MANNIVDYQSMVDKFPVPAGPPPPATVACGSCDPALYEQYVVTITNAASVAPTFAFIDGDTEALGAGVHTLTAVGCIWRKTFVNPNADGLNWFIEMDYGGHSFGEWSIAMFAEDFSDYWLMVWTEHPDQLECTGPAVGAGGPYDDTVEPNAFVALPPGA